MKRDYTSENAAKAKNSLIFTYNKTNHDYRDSYYSQDVPEDQRFLKYDCLSVGSDANKHIQSIREKVNTVHSLMVKFYNDVDSTSLKIFIMGNNILSTLEEVNNSMDRINTILSGLEDYSGKTITPADIKAAGIDEAKCARLKQAYYEALAKDYDAVRKYIDDMNALKENGGILTTEDIVKLKKIFDWYSKNSANLTDKELRNYVDIFELLGSDNLTDEMLDDFMKNNDAVKLYLEHMKALKDKNGSLSPDDMDKVKKIYDWYVKNRFESQENEHIDYMNEQILKNCVDAYELLDPNAKLITDTFFKDAYGLKDKDVDFNVLAIKYSLYTSDPLYRDTILAYLPKMKLKLLNSGSPDVKCSKELNGLNKQVVLYLDLHITYSGNCCSFFHECGHGIDYLSKTGLGSTSDAFSKSLTSDAKNRIYKDLEDYNNSVPNSDKLSPKEKDQIVKYLFDRNKNPNAVKNHGDEPECPKGWSPKQVEAYKYLRKVYGYPSFSYSTCNRQDVSPQTGWCQNESRTGIVDDIFGGMTNSKIGGTGHGYNLNSMSSSDFKDYNDFKNKVVKDSYYHSGAYTNTEFYAESFEYRVLKRSMSATEKVFGSTVGKFDDSVKDAYTKVKDT